MTIKSAIYEFPSPEDSESPNGPAQIKALADKLDANQWKSRSLKPTTGVKQASGSAVLVLTTSYQDVAGTTLEITPDMNSTLRIWAVFGFQAQIVSGLEENYAYGIVNLDTVDQVTQFAQLGIASQGITLGQGALATALSLSASVKHTIKLRARKSGGGGVAVLGLQPLATHFVYDLVAS